MPHAYTEVQLVEQPAKGICDQCHGGDTMGDFNSSVTRVWPVFDWLFQHDPTGKSWLTQLLGLGSRTGEVHQSIHCDPGPLYPELAHFDLALPGSLRKVLGPERSSQFGRIRNAYEAQIPPSEAFLRWLLEHPERLTWPKDGVKGERVFGASTNEKRKRLQAGDSEVQSESLNKLAAVGVSGSQRKWWSFEGFTSVDCLLETDNLLLLIEGKRTEGISDSTDWFPGRNQVIRNLEVARAMAGGHKNFALLLCSEKPVELPEAAWAKSLPHFSAAEIEELKLHYLGCTTWSTIAQQLCNGLQLPDKVDDAITFCLGLRQSCDSTL